MAYSMTWLIQDRVAQLTLSGGVTLEDIIAYSAQIHDEYLGNRTKPIHFIFDVAAMSGFPTQVIAIKRASESYMHHQAMGWVVFVGIQNPLMGFLANTVAQTQKIKSQQAKTVEEAMGRLKRLDPSIADVST
jgi:hypothetical protein